MLFCVRKDPDLQYTKKFVKANLPYAKLVPILTNVPLLDLDVPVA